MVDRPDFPRALTPCTIGLLAALAACAPSVSGAPGGPAPGEHTLFFDDFDESALDRARWNVEVRSRTYNDEQQAYVDEPAVIHLASGRDAEGAANGALVIEARYRPGVVYPEGVRLDFVSGHLDTRGKFEFTYGTAAARMKLPAGAGLWPAFWILGGGDWPATGEIDVMENVGAPDWSSEALHGPGYSGDTPLVSRFHYPAGTDATGWHVYAVTWSPDSLRFTVDDHLAYLVTRPIVERYGRWAFDNKKFLIVNLALGGGYPSAVNGVKSPYLGLPDSTVARIRSGDARVLVDWVRVTAR